VVAAVLLLLGAATDGSGLAIAGAALVLATMAGALATHVRIGDAPPRMAPPAVLAVIAVVLLVTA